MPAVVALAPASPAPRYCQLPGMGRSWNPLLFPACKGKTGRPAQDNRRFINAVFWILRTGAPWRDLPPDYGDWKNTHLPNSAAVRDRNVWAGLPGGGDG